MFRQRRRVLARSDLAKGGAIVDGGCELRDVDGDGQDFVHSVAPLVSHAAALPLLTFVGQAGTLSCSIVGVFKKP